jgi:hypothetical protein
MDLGTVFAIHNGAIQIDRLALERGVDKPVAGGGDVEAADQRRRRLTGEVKAEKTKGTKVFLKVVAAREDISTQRLKQILEAPSEPTRKPR